MTDDIEFRIPELPKFKKGLPELASDLDIWLYFLRYAAMMEIGALPAELDRPVVTRAWEELNMLSQAEIERERYEARWKAQLDHNSLVNAARRAEKIGLEKGEQIGMIHVYERLLDRPETPTEHLAALSAAELSRLAEELRNLVKR